MDAQVEVEIRNIVKDEIRIHDTKEELIKNFAHVQADKLSQVHARQFRIKYGRDNEFQPFSAELEKALDKAMCLIVKRMKELGVGKGFAY